MRLFASTLIAGALAASPAHAVFLDLRSLSGVTPGAVPAPIDVEGVRLTLPGNRYVSTASGLGVDGSGANDDSRLLDAGNGSAESLGFLFAKEVYVDRLVISQFDPIDAGVLSIKGRPSVAVHDGDNWLSSVVAGGTSFNTLTWSGALGPGAGRGFGVVGFEVRLVAALGDFNFDHDVNGLDLAAWRQDFGRSGPLNYLFADGNYDVTVDGADLLIWQRRLGENHRLAPPATKAVPEGASLWLAAHAIALSVATRAAGR